MERIRLLQDFTDAELRALRSYCTEGTMPPGGVFFRRGEPADTGYILTSGTVRVTTSPAQGVQELLYQLGPGEGLGMLSLLDGGKRAFDAVAETEVSYLAISRERLEALLASPEPFVRKFLINMIRCLGGKFRETKAQYETVMALVHFRLS